MVRLNPGRDNLRRNRFQAPKAGLSPVWGTYEPSSQLAVSLEGLQAVLLNQDRSRHP
jgi:hypothetical protein